MKNALFFAALLTGQTLLAQTTDLQKLARQQAQRSQFDSAYRTLSQALQQKPDDADLLKDQAYICILKRDFENGLRIGQTLIKQPNADEQSYQLMGMVYKNLAEYKEAEKMYKDALQKFPASGVLYSEYGDMLAQDGQQKQAISIWEKGIQQDVNSNSNYYYAAKYYAGNDNLLWSLLYGEIFVNIESYTTRTEEIKTLLYNGYKKLFTGNTLAQLNSKAKGFSKAFTDVVVKNVRPFTTDTIGTITNIRLAATADWVNNGNSKKFPFRLFDLHRQLIDNKSFAAYNQWLFGNAAGTDKYDQWKQANAAQMDQWEQILHNVVFKIPAGQYYSE